MRRSALPLLAVALGSCMQGDDRYPSLLPRPYETQSLTEPVRPVIQATPDAALDARIAAVLAPLDAAARDFVNAAQNAEALIAVARGLPEGSAPWLEAQAALAALGTARAPTLSVLTQLEEMAIERGRAGEPPYPALDAAVTQAEAAASAQAARIAGLEAALAGD